MTVYAALAVSDPLDESFEEWARKRAATEGLGDEERQRQLGDSAHWTTLDERWSQQLADDLRNGRLDRATRLAELVAEELGRRGQLPQPSPSQRGGGGTGGTPFDDDLDDFAQTNRVPSVRIEDTKTGPPSFKNALAGVDDVRPPEPGQTHTQAGGIPGRSVDELRAIGQAMAWTVEQYARYRADLVRAPDPRVVLEEHSLHVGKAKQRVEEAWSRRLNEDADLLRRYEAAFESLE